MMWPPPSLWVTICFVVLLFYRCARRRQWPDTTTCVELVAYGAGVYGASVILLKSLATSDLTEQFTLFTGALVTGVVSLRGASKAVSREEQAVHPIHNGPASAESTKEPSEPPTAAR